MALDRQDMFPGTLVDAIESLLLPLGNSHFPLARLTWSQLQHPNLCQA